MENISIGTLQARRDALIKKLAKIGPVLQGTLSVRKVKCGNPNCRCAAGEPHEACILTKKVAGKTVTTHVPRDLRDEVMKWTQEYRRLKELTAEISELNDQIIRLHVPTSRAAARNQKNLPPTPSG